MEGVRAVLHAPEECIVAPSCGVSTIGLKDLLMQLGVQR